MGTATQVASPPDVRHRPHHLHLRRTAVPYRPTGPDGPPPAGGGSRPGGLPGLRVTTLMNTLIVVAAAVTYLTAGVLEGQPGPGPLGWGPGALRLFALWCLAFLPGWMYVRFLDLRAQALWNEYVLTLHRLGWDRACYLPKPPADSVFYARWAEGGEPPARAENIYRQKFEAYYGRRASPAVADGKPVTHPGRESLFPVFLTTAVLAAGWCAVLWDTRFLTAPSGVADVLKYGFLGAYAFVISMLIRRYFQSDLRPSAYASAVFRIMFVLLTVGVLHQILVTRVAAASRTEMAVAFVIGFFPLVGLQALQRLASKALGRVVPPVTSDYPLERLDGLNLWYEARLTEEGVEDMQNLTTMNLVDVILHTRVPPGRLVDWTDQAFLLIHLEQADAAARQQLRRVGIRTATDLLKAFSAEQPQPDGSRQREFTVPHGCTTPLPEGQLRLLVTVLAQEPGLTPVWNWQSNGVPAHPAVNGR
jgi:hypothetical protein